ncbi:MAG: hypothetical protein PHO02_03160 [Candidatus Nanoarchaeia archaeon]|nr:hypothetical protein [Candidatus Nanoarchaeia archaeon]
MPETKFIFDRAEKEARQTVKDIISIVQKKPYPDPNTTILAGFIHALFQTGSKIKQVSPAVKEEAPLMPSSSVILQKGLPPAPKYSAPKPIPMPVPVQPMAVQPAPVVPQTGLLAKENNLLPPMPEAPSAVFKRREYSINSFDNQIGIVVDKDSSGKIFYAITEPKADEEVLKLTKESIEKDFEKDFKILDNKEMLDRKIEKACKKKNAVFTEDYAKAVTYLLKRDLLGFRKIDALMYDASVLAIFCEGINKPVLVELKDIGKVPTNIIFTEVIDLNALLYKIARATGEKLSDEKPILDTEYQGYKIQAVLGIGGMSSKLIVKK